MPIIYGGNKCTQIPAPNEIALIGFCNIKPDIKLKIIITMPIIVEYVFGKNAKLMPIKETKIPQIKNPSIKHFFIFIPIHLPVS